MEFKVKKFTIGVGQRDFSRDGTTVEKKYSNGVGQWHVMVKRDGDSIAGVISLKPTSSFFNFSQSSAEVILNCLRKFYLTYYATAYATKILDQPTFLFTIPSIDRNIIQNFCIFEITIEIDLSSVEAVDLLLSFEDDTSSAITHSKEMFETGKLADVTITTAEMKEIKAHSFFLSRSPVFNVMLNSQYTKEAAEKAIKIHDIEYEVLVEMLRFMYTDEIQKIKQMACGLLVAANKYDLPGLGNKCAHYLTQNIEVENFAEVWMVANRLELKQLKAVAVKFFKIKSDEIFATEGWKELDCNNFQLVSHILKLAQHK